MCLVASCVAVQARTDRDVQDRLRSTPFRRMSPPTAAAVTGSASRIRTVGYSSGSVVNSSGYSLLRAMSVALVAFASASSLVKTATTQTPR